MNHKAFWLCALLLPAAAAACTGKLGETGSTSDGGTGGDGGSGSGTGPGSSSGGATTGPGGTTSTSSGMPPIEVNCAAPELGKPVLRLMNSAEFNRSMADIFPEIAGKWTNSLPSDTISSYGFDNDGTAVAGAQYTGAVLDTATALATALIGTPLATVLPCSTSGANQACAEQFLTKYGRRLFRRPITTAEHDRYLAFFTTASGKSDFKTAIKWMTIALIQSPNALYRSEIGAVSADGTRKLSPYEVATELAYTYGGSTPTDALLTQAGSGSLGDPAAIAKTLLATPAGKQALHHFFESYLGYPRAVAIEKSGIPNYATMRADMVAETKAFIDDVVFQKQQGLSELLTSPTTNPSKKLAGQYYTGFPSPASDYASVTRPNGQGIGLLAQGSILASHALPDGSSPTQRGLLVFKRLLCEETKAPPPNVPQIGTPQPGKVTTRERYENQHLGGTNGNGGCGAGCHNRFDPIGFGFEHFNEGGIYRADEGGLAINTVSTVPNPDLTATPLISFQSEEELVQGLAKQPLVYQCFTAYLATYAYGTGDKCLGSSQAADLQAGKIGIADLFVGMSSSPHFSTRAGQ